MRQSRRFRLRILTVALLGGTACECGARTPWTIAAADPETRRTTPAGEVVGGAGRYGSQAWLGIPFAAPPVGDLRWRSPKHPAPWTAPFEAIHRASACPQYASPLGGVEGEAGTVVGSEDCLYLNLWTPKFAPKEVPQGTNRLPVMVWIHGGGNTIGTTAFYDGGHLAADQKVVVVAVQYRLGPFGWFRHRALRDAQSDAVEQSGNFGTLDLIRSLEWVRDNIDAFGGDPGNVTIFGESAGGENVFSLLLAPQAKGLFHRAISESGGLSDTSPEDGERFSEDADSEHRNSSNDILARLLQHDGEARDIAGAKEHLGLMSDTEIARYLRSKSPADILRATDSAGSGMIDMPLVFRDGAVLPATDWTARFAQADGWNKVPVILGTNRDEMNLFLYSNKNRIRRRLGLFPRYVDEPDYQATAEYLSRGWKATAADAPADAMRRSGEPDVYVYRFDWHDEPTVLGADLSRMLGAAHGLEIPFVFGHFDLGPRANRLFTPAGAPARDQLSHQMMEYWATFARSGSPTRGGPADLPAWSAWDTGPSSPKTLVLDIPSAGGIRMIPAVEARDRIIADADADPRLPTQRAKCRVYRGLLANVLSKADYPHVGKLGCEAFPLDAVAPKAEGNR